MSAPKKQTPGEVGTKGQANATSQADAPIINRPANADKAFANLREAFAFRGHELRREVLSDGSAQYVASRWGLERRMSFADAVQFLVQIGGAQ